MNYLTSADNLLIATLWLRVLQADGIDGEIRNQYLAGAIGELPALESCPEIWLRHARDLPRAMELLTEMRMAADTPTWDCPTCAEILEGQFFECWRCGTRRAP